ncbi:MAG: hypothetical protein F6K40_20135 [Okeania sp. SIO3I5]|uniref:hypothetical protein n=1 Tax=Okeania sp. SIO3I5 TaxID=2607805 RepID=UPI0013B9E5D5|nr:hypothetical protein [Okeania sp. SIO3I5]NEQ38451.1 hypothetical protein [Okeania sp. SIO3I5]
MQTDSDNGFFFGASQNEYSYQIILISNINPGKTSQLSVSLDTDLATDTRMDVVE